MAELTHIMDGQSRGVPRDWQSLKISVDWKDKKESGAINVSDLSFTGEANEYIQQWIADGNIFEGIPYLIAVGDVNNPAFQFKGYLDLTDNPIVIGGEESKCSLKKDKGTDWLNDTADSFSMAYLYSIGRITNADIVRVPYVINYVPDGIQLIVIGMSIYMMTRELIDDINRTTKSIADSTAASTPVVGVSVGVGGGVVTAWSIGLIVSVALKIIADIVLRIAMSIAMKALTEELFEQLIPKKRYHLGMTFNKMMERSCQHLGLGYSSNLMAQHANWTHIPTKDRKGGDRGEFGYPDNSSPIYTFGDLIREMKKMFNADYRIVNGIFYFEVRDSFKTPTIYQMPPVLNNQDRRLEEHTYNTDEMISNYNILWDYDVQDQNTLDDQSGRIFQAITSARTAINPEYVTIKNLAQIAIPFSMAKEKTKLTDVEKILKTLGKLVDNITGIFGGGTNFAGQIEDRIGSLLLSSHFLTTGKVVVMQGGKLASGQRALLSSRLLWDKYHYKNSFAPYNGEHNQYRRILNKRVPMSLEDFTLLLENNEGLDDEGKEIEIEKFEYFPDDQTGVIDYRRKELYSRNLKITLL